MSRNATPRSNDALKSTLRVAGLILIPAVALAASAATTRTVPDPPGPVAERSGPGIAAACHDNDQDGYAACIGGCQPGGQTCGDCNDIDPNIHPGAAEICNHQDDDCDGTPDEGMPAVDTSRLVLNAQGQTFDGFGDTIARLDDLTDDGVPELAIGASVWDNSAGVQTGSISVVSGADGSPFCRMVDPQGISTDDIGDKTAVIGDVNGDGVGDLATDGNGKVVIFSAADCSVIRRCTSVDFNHPSVSGVGDLDLDGVPDLLVGTAGVTVGGVTSAGRLVALSGANCGTIFTYVEPAPQIYDGLGGEVAGIGDVTGDGRPDVLTRSARFVYVLSGVGGTLVRRIAEPATVGAARFTGDLAAVPDLSGDGVPDIAVGTGGNNTNLTSPGSVLLFSGSNGALLRRCVDPGAMDYDRLASSLAVIPDQDGDGKPEILAGIPYADTARGFDAGRAILFSGADCGVLKVLEDPQGEGSAYFGKSVASAGDLSGDGLAEIAAGPTQDPSRSNMTAVLLVAHESVCDDDGISPWQGDCDDTRTDSHPGAPEVCDGRDNDCDSGVDEDADGDGFGACTDCDNGNPLIHPGAVERCNGIDDDCDGATDEGPDADGDGYTTACDCNDADPSIHPGAPDPCDNVDRNCDGRIDEGSPSVSLLVPGPDPDHGVQYLFEPLATPGDVDQDGVSDIAVGIPIVPSPAGANAGEVVIYSGRDRSELCRLKDPEGSTDERYGTAMVALPDVTGDGIGDLVVSSPGDDVGSLVDAGSIAIVSGSGCGRLYRCTDPAIAAGWKLGAALAAIGDLNGDGIPEVAASAPGGGPQANGIVTIFDPVTCTPLRHLIDPQNGTDTNLQMGQVLAPAGDVNGDGVPDVAVLGAGWQAGVNVGGVLLFSGADGTLIRRLLYAGTGSGSQFGRTIALIGDVDGDGTGDLAVGAYIDSIGTGVQQSGSISLYSGRTGSFLRLITAPQITRLGSALAAIGDVSGDGVPDILAGADANAYNFPEYQSEAGAVLIISGSDGAVLDTIRNPAGRAGDFFGRTLLVPGDLGGVPSGEIVASSEMGLFIISRESDCDGDGVTPFAGDCDDANAARAASFPEICDAIDNDCDGGIDEDDDGDEFAVCADCDDQRASTHPGAVEVCNRRDDDCDGTVDEGFDADGDGVPACSDNCPAIANPGQEDFDDDGVGNACDAETCDGIDNDGNGSVDEGFAGIPETCNHQDDNCDGLVDPVSPHAWGAHALVPPDPATWQTFGRAVAGVGDVTGDRVPDLVVGADSYSGAGQSDYLRGRALLLSGVDLSARCEMEDPHGEHFDRLGSAAAGLGDVNGDGIGDIAVSSREDNNGAGGYRGSVSIFSGADCSFVRKCADPTGPSGSFYEYLGMSLTALGDVNGDGVPDLAAGAPGAQPAGVQGAGAVLVFSGADCSVLRRLTDPLGTSGAQLGSSLAATGDISGDGVGDLLVGAGGGNGKALVFSIADGTVLRRLTDPGAVSGGALGSAVAALPDITSDGVPDLAVGAMLDDAGAPDAGSVSIFSGATGALLRKCADPIGSPKASLGSGLAAYPDFDGDGIADLVALAPFQHTPAGPVHGTALVLSGATCAVLDRVNFDTGRVVSPFPVSGIPVSLPLAVPGDLDGDHAAEIVIGAPWAAGGGLALVYGRTSDCDGDGATPLGGDCDDTSGLRAPGRVEICDNQDNNCNALVDEDTDGDGFAACQDCDNGRAAAHPGAAETCNGLDDDCNALADDGPDRDADGFTVVCDCDDGTAGVHPGAADPCNGRDDDCDGTIDEGLPQNRVAGLVTDPAGASNERFGKQVGGIGDVDADGVPDLAVGNDTGEVLIVSGRTGAARCRGTGRGPFANLGDVSGDGVPDVAVGDSNLVRVLSGATCAQVRTCSDGGSINKGFGSVLTAVGDIDGDGVTDLAAGLPSGGTNSQGEVAVFSGATCGLLYRVNDPSLVPASGFPVRFGASVAGPGDLTGDGWPDLVVGAPNDTSLGISSAGRLVVVSGPDGTIVRRISHSGAAVGDRLGDPVVTAGNLDGDGVPDFFATIAADEPGRTDVGAVLLISGATGSVLRRCVDPTAPAFEGLGRGLVAIGDVTGDGMPDFAASELGSATPGAPNAGAVILFSSADCGIAARLLDPSPVTTGFLAHGSLAAPGDLNGDGRPDIVAGADWTTSPVPFPRGHVVVFTQTSACEAPDNCPAVPNRLQADADADAAGNLCDVCPAIPDPSQADTDRDGLGDACDCRLDDATSRAPGDQVRVDVNVQGRVIWTAAASAESYLVRRGDLSQRAFGYYGACWQQVTGVRAGDIGVADATIPAPGTGFFYLVQGSDSPCGTGSLGFDSQERLRVVSGPDPCP